MSWRGTADRVVVGVLLGLTGGVACAQNPSPAPATSGKTSDVIGQNLSGLQFDPQGADFTLWVNRFKDEAYRNWNIPEAANLGAARGHVDFEFTVERDGTMSSLRSLRSSGTASLDKAAEIALRASKLLPLPREYGPPRVTMWVTFHYNERPR